MDDLTDSSRPNEPPDDYADPRAGRLAGVKRLPHLVRLAFHQVWAAGRHELIVCLILDTLSAVAVAVQLLIGRAIVARVVGSGHHTLGQIAPQVAGLAVVTALVSFASPALTEHKELLTELLTRHVQGQIIDVVAQAELPALESPAFHDRLHRAKQRADQHAWQVAFGLVQLAGNIASLVALAAVLGGIEPMLLPLLALAYLPLAIATAYNSRAAYNFAYGLTATDRERAYLERVLTSKDEAKEVRLFGLGRHLRGRYDRLYDRRIAALRQLIAKRLRRSLVANCAATVAVLVGVVALLQLTLSGHLSAANAAIGAVAIQQLGVQLRGVNGNAAALQESSLFLEDLITFLDLKPRVDAQQATRVPALPVCSRLTLEHVSFHYPGTTVQVLDDVAIEVGAGEIVALVGKNGAGKTTLAKVLCGLYQPSAGQVLWDGADPAECPRLTAIFQDFARFELAARDNVGLGDPDRIDDLEGIKRAARAAGIDGVLAALPAGYDTRLSRSYEGGVDLSMGQWQRVALARALFRDAPFLVLDEPTAALDAQSEYELFAAIRSLQRGRSVLLISHRFSSVRSADRIYVLERGRVIEQGTHQDLMAMGGQYAELFTMQASAYLDAGNGSTAVPVPPGTISAQPASPVAAPPAEGLDPTWPTSNPAPRT